MQWKKFEECEYLEMVQQNLEKKQTHNQNIPIINGLQKSADQRKPRGHLQRFSSQTRILRHWSVSEHFSPYAKFSLILKWRLWWFELLLLWISISECIRVNNFHQSNYRKNSHLISLIKQIRIKEAVNWVRENQRNSSMTFFIKQ